MDFTGMTTEELCEKYKLAVARDGKVSNPETNALGMEIVRRGIVERDNLAIQTFMDVHEPMVRRWVFSETQFPKTDQSSGYFVSWAYSKFFTKISPAKYGDFATIGHFLRYLMLCARTNVRQYYRDNFRPLDLELPPDLPDGSSSTDQGIEVAELWAIVRRAMHSDTEWLVMKLHYQDGFKPSQIARLHPEIWSTPQHVSTMLYRIRRRLRNDPDLQEWRKPRS